MLAFNSPHGVKALFSFLLCVGDVGFLWSWLSVLRGFAMALFVLYEYCDIGMLIERERIANQCKQLQQLESYLTQ